METGLIDYLKWTGKIQELKGLLSGFLIFWSGKPSPHPPVSRPGHTEDTFMA